MQVTVEFISGPDADGFTGVGVLARYVNSSNFYCAYWTVGVGFTIAKKLSGVTTILATESGDSPLLSPFGLRCLTHSLSLIVNDEIVTTVSDSSLSGTSSGIYVTGNSSGWALADFVTISPIIALDIGQLVMNPQGLLLFQPSSPEQNPYTSPVPATLHAYPPTPSKVQLPTTPWVPPPTNDPFRGTE